jgi:hypothetical protein
LSIILKFPYIKTLQETGILLFKIDLQEYSTAKTSRPPKQFEKNTGGTDLPPSSLRNEKRKRLHLAKHKPNASVHGLSPVQECFPGL